MTRRRTPETTDDVDGPEVESSMAVDVARLPGFLNYPDIPDTLLGPLRTIVNRYELRTDGEIPSPLVVTAPTPTDVRTSVSQALAAILAQERGKYVAWIDCNWLRQGEDYDDGEPVGLVDILSNRNNVLAALRSSPDLPQLTQLRIGRVPAGRGHMIARSYEFERLLAALAEEFDHVILDTPALLGAGDGLALLPRARGYLLVARHRGVSLGQVRKACELAAPTVNIGVVLTDYETKIPASVQRLFER